MRGRTTPTHHPPPPRTAWTPQRGTTPGRVHRVRLNAHRGPGRTRRASPAASMPTLDTTHRVSGTRTRPNAPSELGPISRVRALAPLHLRALRGHERVDDADALRCGDVQPQLIIQLLHGLPDTPAGNYSGPGASSPLNAHRGPGRTRRASPAASIPTLDTTHRVSGTRTRPNAPSELGPISRVRALAPLHLRGTTWTRTGRPRRLHVVWGHTILILALAIRRIASKRAQVTTLTKRGSLVRPPAPLALTTISPDQPVLPIVSTLNRATTSPIQDQPRRAPAN